MGLVGSFPNERVVLSFKFAATSPADAASVAMGLAADFPVAAGPGLNSVVAFGSSPAHAV